MGQKRKRGVTIKNHTILKRESERQPAQSSTWSPPPLSSYTYKINIVAAEGTLQALHFAIDLGLQDVTLEGDCAAYIIYCTSTN